MSQAQSPMKGSCKYWLCGSQCCRRFRLYSPSGTPPTEADVLSYSTPYDEYLLLIEKAPDMKLLLAWRGITVRREEQQAVYVFPYVVHMHSVPCSVGYAMQFEGLVCRHLRDNGTCDIQQRKPKICKEFPRCADEVPDGCGYERV